MNPGHFCRALAQYPSVVTVRLRPTSFEVPDANTLVSEDIEISSKFTVSPTATRLQHIKEMNYVDPRPNAVCTVQTFRNGQSGILLYMFAAYYLKMGWRYKLF